MKTFIFENNAGVENSLHGIKTNDAGVENSLNGIKTNGVDICVVENRCDVCVVVTNGSFDKVENICDRRAVETVLQQGRSSGIQNETLSSG